MTVWCVNCFCTKGNVERQVIIYGTWLFSLFWLKHVLWHDHDMYVCWHQDFSLYLRRRKEDKR
jgi:hypothetical protein